MKTSTGYWASSALAAILNDCLLNPNTYLQNLQVKLSHIYLLQYWVKLGQLYMLQYWVKLSHVICFNTGSY